MGARELLIVRHAPAEDAGPGGDAGRALTREGRAEMADAAAGLARLLPGLDLIASSPLLRARETAELIGAAFPAAARATLGELAPGFERDALATRLDAEPARRIVLVGHEPDLSALIGWLVGGAAGARVHMRKGAAALLSLRGAFGPRAAELEWFATRAILRRLGRARP